MKSLFTEEEEKNLVFRYSKASKWVRALNYILDCIPCGFLIFFFTFSLTGNGLLSIYLNFSTSTILILGVVFPLFIYHFAFEYFFQGKTLAKFLTQTRAVQTNGERLTLKNALLRSLFRFFPANNLSIFTTGDNTTWHDDFSNTQVVLENDYES